MEQGGFLFSLSIDATDGTTLLNVKFGNDQMIRFLSGAGRDNIFEGHTF